MTKYGYKPKDNDRRIIKRFAVFPITIREACNRWRERQFYERKWLEIVYIEQHYNLRNGWWENSQFVTKEEFIMYKKDLRS